MCTAVTAACMATRREVWEDIGGFDEELAVSFNDVDFCLRARALGWRTAWTPFAEAVHYESTSRGSDTEPLNVERARVEAEYVVDRWNEWLQSDPAYNPNLTFGKEDYSLGWPPRIGRFESRRLPKGADDVATESA